MAGLQSALAYRLALVDQERQQQQQGYDFLRRSLLHKVVAACAQGGSAAKLDHHGGRVSSSDELVIRDERGIASTGDSDVVSNAGDDMTGVSVSSQWPSPDEETEEPPSRKLLGFQRTPMESVSAKGKKREEGTFGAGMLETTGGRLQGLDDSDVVPSFRPTISLVSARLARQRRLKDRAEGLPISEYLFQRGKATNRVSKQEQGETVRAHADPTVATRVRKVTFTASTMERLYSNPKGKQGNDTQHRKQQLQDISPTDIDLPFHPLISERAAKLQRGTSRKVHDDLYEHGVRRQLQKNCAQPRNEPSFHPTINQDRITPQQLSGCTIGSHWLHPGAHHNTRRLQSSWMAKKGKKNSAPQLVAPEPVADELEVDILWDAVKEVDDKPPFMDGTHLDATRALFKLEKTGRGAPDVPHNFFQLRERNLSVVRARDRFVLAEQRLKERMEVDEGLQDDDQCFLSLKQSEGEEYLRERRAAMENIAGVKSALVEDQLGLITRMEEAAEDFFRGWNDLLEEVTALATGDSKVSAAFEEKRTLTKTFREAEEQYFHDHGEHVVGIREMRRETKRQQDEMLQSMVTRLGAGVVEMARLSVEELEDKAAQQEETTRLISELMKVQGKSTVLEKQTIAINEHRATLQRLIDLEVQKQEFCILRQKQIESDLKTLSETVKHNNEQLLLLSSNAAPCQEYKKLLPMIPTSPNTISNLTNVQDKSLLLLTVEAKRQLEGLDAELKTLKDELATLRRRHIVHLSGKYKPTATDGPLSAMKKTAELGIETTSAIRSAVLNSLEQVCRCLGCTEDAEAPGDPLERLFAITDVEERKAVQLYVSRCISKLFSSECPTALPVPFPRSSEGIQWDMLPSH